MQVLIITALYPPAVGGAATYFGDILPLLAQRDEIDHLVVLTERMPGQPRVLTQGKLRLLRYLPTRVSLPRSHWVTHAATYVLVQLWFATRLSRLVQDHRVGLVHFHTRYRGKQFYAALRRSGVPVLADLRDKMTDPARLADVADRLLCCGEGVQRFAVERGFPAERTELVPIPFTPPGIPPAEQVFEIRKRHSLGDRPYLLFVGDITYSKGVYDLLDGYQRWKTKHPQVQLVLVGTNRDGERFVSRARRTVGATYLGHVPHGDVLALMRGAEIVVLPSRSEGLPRVILEAVSLGTKVLCPPEIPEFERHLADFSLPRSGAYAIGETLDNVWRSRELPSYPLSKHRAQLVVSDLVRMYSVTAEGEAR